MIGTRSAVFAPVGALGLVAVWDDGDDTLAEPRAPYPHAREVAMLRADARRTPESQLTPREQQILARLAQGRSYGAIASDLSVSYKTVTNACSQMRQKLGVRTLAELIHVAVTHAQRQG